MVAIVEVRFLLMFRSMEARVGSYYFYWKRIHTAGQFFSMHSLFALSNRFLLVRLSETSMACWQSGQMRVAVTHLVLPTEVRVLYTPR